MGEERLTELERAMLSGTFAPATVDRVLAVIAEARRLTLALRILAGLPDDAGVTHAAELGDHAAYARGVLAGAEALPVEMAIRRGYAGEVES